MDSIDEAFGEGVSLYSILGLKEADDAEDPAKLRKAYFRKALVYHPDKTKEKDPDIAKSKFQAISLAYQVLQNEEQRAHYRETGEIDSNHDDDDEDGENNWKDYFDRIFGKVTTSKIDQFALKYKCSEEEQADVLKEYKRWKGNLVKMLEFVMLSEPLDAKRWVEDYITPAVQQGSVDDYHSTLQKTLKQLEKKILKQQQNTKKKSSKPNDEGKTAHATTLVEEDEEDGETTETDEASEEASPPKKNKQKGKSQQKVAQKAKPSKAKKKKNKEQDLFAMIQANQSKRSGAALFSSLGARYGVSMDNDDDPLDDKEFERIQAKMKKRKR